MVCLRRALSRILRAVWVGASLDGAPVFDRDGADAVCARCNNPHIEQPLRRRRGTAVDAGAARPGHARTEPPHPTPPPPEGGSP